MHGFFDKVTEVFAPWQTYMREKGEEKKREQEHEFAMERTAAERAAAASAEQQRIAMEALEQRNDRLNGILSEVDAETAEIVRIVEKIRRLARSEDFESHPDFVSSAMKEIGDWEAGLVSVQAAGRGVVGSTDMAELAEGIAQANQALYVVRAVRARAVALEKKFASKAKEIQQEKVRLEQLRRQQKLLKEQEARAFARLEEERRFEMRQVAAQTAREARMEEMKRLNEVELQIARERRLLASARAELESLRARLASSVSGLKGVA